MNASDADRQIKPMVDFILQEAQEKANEIRIKKEHEVNKRIARSAEIGASRRQKMIARDELLKTLIVEGQSQLKNYTILDDKSKVLLRDLTRTATTTSI
ncbi:unnamed protein product [Peronospora destructor]|uniref:Uncharacterized protein n=1 Tax=Peronospora destructor TaxID=86335 RepID=A0AAV0V521_9STRA|nr:unnamed protein product [Peronospora destructor]